MKENKIHTKGIRKKNINKLLVGCTILRYPNWEYVRVETELPNKNCVYKIPEPFSEDGNHCLEWHK